MIYLGKLAGIFRVGLGYEKVMNITHIYLMLIHFDWALLLTIKFLSYKEILLLISYGFVI